ncbi:MAG TPA: lipopolysaccharide biosynthesis protein, partial [Thermodesulfobacteriota bacterium]|nr:lipopolysaccharide biosynthesis protein [Thermodesulfobacteriota bacterium]
MSDLRTLGRNTAARYAAFAVDAAAGLLLLPYNLSRLGAADYGLWILSASVARYVSFLDLGFGGGLVRFVAECRARGETRRLSELASTTMVAFAVTGTLAFAVMAVVAVFYDRLFPVDPRQAAAGRVVLLLVAARVAAGLPLSVFGAVINGAQRYALNNAVGIGQTLLAAAANVAVLERGGGVVAVVAATTAVHLAASAAYVVNAYRVQPGLVVSWRLANRARLAEVGRFSAYLLVLDWAHKVNYSLDTLVIGTALGPRAVAAFTPALRIAQTMRDLTGQFHSVLFPAVVDLRTRGERQRLATLCLEGTRLSLVLALAVGVPVIVLARPLLAAWVGPAMAASAPALQVLAAAMVVRVGQATVATILKGAGGHRFLALNNSLVAAANLALSLALVRPLGITGVALGTALPVALGTLSVVPEGCRRLGLPLRQVARRAIWPALWPAGPAAAALWA